MCAVRPSLFPCRSLFVTMILIVGRSRSASTLLFSALCIWTQVIWILYGIITTKRGKMQSHDRVLYNYPLVSCPKHVLMPNSRVSDCANHWQLCSALVLWNLPLCFELVRNSSSSVSLWLGCSDSRKLLYWGLRYSCCPWHLPLEHLTASVISTSQSGKYTPPSLLFPGIIGTMSYWSNCCEYVIDLCAPLLQKDRPMNLQNCDLLVVEFFPLILRKIPWYYL